MSLFGLRLFYKKKSNNIHSQYMLTGDNKTHDTDSDLKTNQDTFNVEINNNLIIKSVIFLY